MSTQKREKIIKTAMRLFVEKGIQGTPTSLIAKEAGVATGTLFHHFKTKEDLVHELYHSIFDSIIALQEVQFDEGGTIIERLHQAWKIDLEWGMQHTEYVHFLERYSIYYYASESAAKEFYERFSLCSQIFHDAIDAGAVKVNSFDYMQEHYTWNMRMNMMYFINNPKQYTAKNITETFEIYWKGISK